MMVYPRWSARWLPQSLITSQRRILDLHTPLVLPTELPPSPCMRHSSSLYPPASCYFSLSSSQRSDFYQSWRRVATQHTSNASLTTEPPATQAQETSYARVEYHIHQRSHIASIPTLPPVGADRPPPTTPRPTVWEQMVHHRSDPIGS